MKVTAIVVHMAHMKVTTNKRSAYSAHESDSNRSSCGAHESDSSLSACGAHENEAGTVEFAQMLEELKKSLTLPQPGVKPWPLD